MDWTILGIGPTDDKKAITAAYRAKLKTTNPEDKPEEFKALRAAYEEALRLADQDQTAPEEDLSPVGRWAARVEALYNDYQRRIEVQNWTALLDDDVCAALDTRPQAEDALLRFLMERYYVPHGVWLAFDAAFGWSERIEELCESYPREFLEQCVLNGIHFEQVLTYEHFEPGRDAAACDAYRQLYYQCRQSNFEQQEELLDRLESMPEQHPYGRALRCNWLFAAGQKEAAREGFRALSLQWPEDTMLSLDYAMLCSVMGDYEEGEAITRRVLAKVPAHIYAKRTLAECLAGQGKQAEAKELLYEVMHASGDDPILGEQISERLRAWNGELIARYREALDRDPGDTASAIELAWCYLQNESPDESMEIALKIDPEKADAFDYHNLMGKLYHNIEMFADAAEHMQALVALMRTMEPDGTDKTQKRLARLPEMLQVWGNCLMQTGETDRAQEIFREALDLAPDDPKVLTLMGNILFSSDDYAECLEVMTHLTTVSPGSWFGHLMQAMCLYRLHRDREAFDALNRAQSLQGGDLSLYVLKMQILLRNGAFDEVRDILAFLEEAGAPEDIALDFIRAQLTELADGNEDAAFRSYQTIARKVDEGETLIDEAALRYRMALLMGERMDPEKEEDLNILLSILEKGLRTSKYDADCLNYKAWLLKRGGRLEEAIEMYKTLPIPDAKRKLLYVYHEDLDRYCSEAMACCRELLELSPTPELCYYATAACRHTGDWEGAVHYCNMALEMDPGDIDACNALAYHCERQGDLEGALVYIDRALESMRSLELFYEWLLGHKLKLLRRLGRHAQALELIDRMMQDHDLPGGFHEKFDICCQFGLWDQAEALLDQWQAARRGDPDQVKSTGHLHLLRGKMLKATFAFGKVKHSMTADEELDLRLQLAELEANAKRQIQLLSQKLDTAQDKSHVLLNLALAFFWNGDREGARKIAAKGLELIDERLRSYQPDETLYRTRRSALLALLGRMEEARAELDHTRKLPLCEHCAYGRCKDADIYEAYIEEIAGNRDRARALCQAGKKNWPDELDFHAGETRLKKKGK